jgi:hypothetical protein
MRDAAALGAVEASFGYHNPVRGAYRLEAVRDLIRPLLAQTTPRPQTLPLNGFPATA